MTMLCRNSVTFLSFFLLSFTAHGHTQCNICPSDDDELTNPDTIVPFPSDLNFLGISEATCDQIHRSGLNGLFAETKECETLKRLVSGSCICGARSHVSMRILQEQKAEGKDDAKAADDAKQEEQAAPGDDKKDDAAVAEDNKKDDAAATADAKAGDACNKKNDKVDETKVDETKDAAVKDAAAETEKAQETKQARNNAAVRRNLAQDDCSSGNVLQTAIAITSVLLSIVFVGIL